MASLADRMAAYDAEIFEHIGDTVTIAGSEVKGIFYLRNREITLADGAILALELSFDCQVTAAILALNEGDAVIYKGTSYRFLRRLPEQADESQLVTLQLLSPA